uniref:DNA-binding protein HU n=1 Tax=Chromera velia CCMP2878 TaxID=1169474 RepID=A0A0G4HX52_9ALVE|mmetsp:Transcript_23983/g.47100  ORF Transcript_23983/g.47100 Transcript_23983/m.47100 type:complete len:145 (+) Transcript_23983:228-662(+)|eukprot:Cvel_9214.t1-p1 / transcript=Cvel_9214.t1 / gene=Cvel_9214 / organism=Chromera_velia_CCMP2878 / gene_product=DNA-binding protein HU-1, putative / transcript_product=DNA-binding protein HU-1, putative / location=Cvel_scaffold525:43938-45815(+) / protein_length=144 / sequence_SO=supercontig / SO=protein_coding / is_pseudo=false
MFLRVHAGLLFIFACGVSLCGAFVQIGSLTCQRLGRRQGFACQLAAEKVEALKLGDVAKMVSEKMEISSAQARRFMDCYSEVISDSVKEGKKVPVPNLGSFSKSHRNERTARNPRTGEMLKIPSKDVPVFKPSKMFKQFVNGEE